MSVCAGACLRGLGLSLLAVAAMAAPRLNLVSTEYPPYYGAALPEQGAVLAVVKAVFAAAGYQTEVNFRPWARALPELRAGQHDVVVAVWYQADRERYLAYSEPIWVNQVGFYGRRDQTIDVQSLPALQKWRIGTVRGYANPPAFVASGLQGEDVVDDVSNLRKLDAGRLDLVLIDRDLAAYLLAAQLPQARARLRWLEPAVASMPLHIGFSRARPGYAAQLADFNRGLAQLRKSGEYARIVQRLMPAVRTP